MRALPCLVIYHTSYIPQEEAVALESGDVRSFHPEQVPHESALFTPPHSQPRALRHTTVLSNGMSL